LYYNKPNIGDKEQVKPLRSVSVAVIKGIKFGGNE